MKKSKKPETSVVNIKLQNVMMQLRKCCNHPYLLEYPLIEATGEYKVDEELVSSCGKMLVVDRLLPSLKEKGHKVSTTIIVQFITLCYRPCNKYHLPKFCNEPVDS